MQGSNSLVRFTTAAPGAVGTPLAVTGLTAGDTLKAIDYRPATGALYGIATDVSNAAVRTYTINPTTGAASLVGAQVADLQGRGLVAGTITFNGLDVTGVIASCVVVGSAANGATSLRCPNIGGPVTGPGTHTFVVRLNVDDGTLVQRTVTWTVVAVTEP